MTARIVVVLFVISFIAGLGHYVGSYSYILDVVELVVCLALVYKIKAILLALLTARKPRDTAAATVVRNATTKAFLLGTLTYLMVAWAVLSASDALLFAHGIPISHPTSTKGSGKLAIALSGGGYRAALFHAGLLEELETIGAAPSYISSVSGGSIIGAFYAQGGKPSEFLKAVVAGRFNLERRVLRIDNALGLIGANVNLLWRGGSGKGASHTFTVTAVQAQMFDDLFLHGLLAKDSQKQAVAEQMIGVTDIANSEILGVTSRGAVVRSIDNALLRTKFENPARKGLDFATFLTDDVIHLPGQERLSTLVAASGAFPGVLSPYAVSRWTNTESYNGSGLLADGGLGDNHGVALLDTIQYRSFSARNPENQPGPGWQVSAAMVSDGSALGFRFSPDGYLSKLSRAMDVIYNSVGGPTLVAKREAVLRESQDNQQTAMVEIPRPRLLLLSPRSIAKSEDQLIRGAPLTALWGYELQREYPTPAFGAMLRVQVKAAVPISFAYISSNALRGMAVALPAEKVKRARELIELLSGKKLIGPSGLLTEENRVPQERDQLSPEARELFDIFNAEIDHCLDEYINASTLMDQFDEKQAISIFRLGRFIVRMNESFINCELGRQPCLRVQ